MAHCAAGIDDVGHVTFALGGLRTNQRLTRAGENLRGILLVQDDRADRILSYRADAVCQQQPAVVELDRRSAAADLHEFPRILWLKDGATALPCAKIVGKDEIEVLVVLSSDHGIAAIDLARKKSHAFVARRRSGEWDHSERCEIRRFEQLG